MADGGAGGPKFPGVTVGQDHDDKCILYLKFANLKAKKKGFLGPLEQPAANGKNSLDFDSGSVCVKVSVIHNSQTTEYEYKKNLPEDITKAALKVFKDERLELTLTKKSKGSWERHARYLQTKD